MRDYHDDYMRLQARIPGLEAALRDIAGSEPIPNDRKAWEFCRDVAAAALRADRDRLDTQSHRGVDKGKDRHPGVPGR